MTSSQVLPLTLAILIAPLVIPANADDRILAEAGRTSFVVVLPDQATEPESFAAAELTNHLQQATGAIFPLLKEADYPTNGTPALYLGKTRFAAAHGVSFAKLGSEEWVVRTTDGNLILSGGWPRGPLFAVYEFLERQLGCHWLAADTTIIPKRGVLSLGDWSYQGKPRMRLRLGGLGQRPASDAFARFAIRNKDMTFPCPEAGFYPLGGKHGLQFHTFSSYIPRSLCKDHPEYFAVDKDGKRTAGQLCMTDPDGRRLMVGNLKATIRADREKAAAKGWLPPFIYVVGQEDNQAYCRCAACQAIAGREDSQSGPLLDYVNHVADEVARDYPDLQIMTLSYTYSEKPPKQLKARDNVMVVRGNTLGGEILDPLTRSSPVWQDCLAWAKVAKRMMFYDYWWRSCDQHGFFPAPYTLVPVIPAEFRLCAGAPSYDACFLEFYEHVPGCDHHFMDLERWLGMKLMQNPSQPAEPLIKTFMAGFYGAAAPKMREYLDYLSRRQATEAHPRANYALGYLDLDFFVMGEGILAAAAEAVPPDSRESLHVQKERLRLDGALLWLWPWLEKCLASDQGMPFDREEVLRRYETGWDRQFKSYLTEEQRQQLSIDINSPKQKQWLAGLFRGLPLPEQFLNRPSREVADFNCLTFSRFYTYDAGAKFIRDPDAVGGLALYYQPTDAELRDGVKFGVTGNFQRTVAPKDYPRDRQYHLYEIGRIRAAGKFAAYAFPERLGVQLDLPGIGRVWPEYWDAYISFKLDGPAFIPGSSATNRVSMDRVLLVRPTSNITHTEGPPPR